MNLNMIYGHFYWDPRPELIPVDLPFLHRGVFWYGFFFALGFFLAYGVFRSLLRRFFAARGEKSITKSERTRLAEKVAFYLLVGGLIGARLGEVLFYQEWSGVFRHPLSLIKIWEGGLASHGGALGCLIALWLVSKKVPLSFLRLLDLVTIAVPLTAVCIRIGNFFGQEILGKPTQLPWAVIFGHPAGGEPALPRHPVQIYEAVGYGVIFLFLWGYFLRHAALQRAGRIAGFFFLLVFVFRFCMEWVKEEQSRWLGSESFLTMGQYLSLPFILLGLWLLYHSSSNKKFI